MYPIGLMAHQFHDVDLTTKWPVDGADIASQHPKGGPYALTFRQGSTDIDAAKLELLFSLS
jgi:hypothetical protein